MKIVFLTNQMYMHGGIEKILSQKINYLIEHFGHEVFLITTNQNDKKSVYDLNKNLIINDLQINYIEGISFFHPKNLMKTVVHYFKLKKNIKTLKPDVIVSVSTSPDQYFLPFIEQKIPKIKEFHSSRFNYKENNNWKQNLDNLFNNYNAIVVLNASEAVYYNYKNVRVIPNFTDFYSKINTEISKEKTIIAAGRIAPVKQFDEIIYIWQHIHNDFPDWKVKIFGDGDPKLIEKYQKLIFDLKLNNSVFLLPAAKCIQDEMQKASVYVMTSQSECFPMVLLEAQACSLPIVSYNCPNGPKHIIANNENGFLVENYNRKEFAKKLSLLLHNDTMRIDFANKSQLNLENFSQQKVMNMWNDLLIKQTK